MGLVSSGGKSYRYMNIEIDTSYVVVDICILFDLKMNFERGKLSFRGIDLLLIYYKMAIAFGGDATAPS